MKEDIQTIEDFFCLLKNQPNLFSSDDLVELKRLCSAWPDNYEGIADGIAEWSESHFAIYKALINMPILTRFVMASPEKYKEVLMNVFREKL